MEALQQYVVLVVAGICYCVGLIVKYLIPSERINKFIPLIVGTLGVIINIWYNHGMVNPEIILGGLVSGLATTGLNELGKNLSEFFNKK